MDEHNLMGGEGRSYTISWEERGGATRSHGRRGEELNNITHQFNTISWEERGGAKRYYTPGQGEELNNITHQFNTSIMKQP
jgi:hypothetical protein